MLIQEVGFDIVSVWGQTGWLFKAVLVLLAALIVYVLTRALSSGSRRRSSRP
jgi:hypothetical protein